MVDYRSEKWKKKSEKIKRRDKYQCQLCKRYGKITEAKIVHHIKPADEYPELEWEDSNLVSLCIGCHNKVHGEKGTASQRARYNPPTSRG